MQSNSDRGFFRTNVSLEGTSAIVTGSSRGIGRAVAIELARQGTDVLINYYRSHDAADDVRREIEALGRKAVIVGADVSDLGQHQQLVDAALNAFGKIDILVNNAGITRVADVLQETEADYDVVMNTNLKAPHFLTQRVANYMIAHEVRGCIIYILSISDTLASDNRPAYCISKAGLEMDMKLYASRLAEAGIKVNGVEAGVTDTDMARGRLRDYEEAARKGYIFMFRTGAPEDVAQAVIAAIKIYDTGALIPASGGIMTPVLNLRMMTELESNRLKGQT